MKWPVAVLGAALVSIVVLVLLSVPFPVLAGVAGQADAARDFTPDQIAREHAFHQAVRPWGLGSLGWGLLVSGLLALTGLGARIVRTIPGHWVIKTVLGAAALLVLGALVTVPLDVRAEQVLREYGLSTQTWSGWVDHRLRGLALALVSTAVVVVPLMAFARRWPTRWWLPGAALAGLLVVGGSFAYPVLVEPLFNNFTPLPAGSLRTDLLALAERDSIAVQDVLVADASRRTTSVNAYVSGFGATRRIVVYDTLLRSATPAEVELVVAHELGHVKTQDVLVGTTLGALAAVAAVCGAFLLLRPVVLRRVGATGAGDPAIVPLVLFVATAVPLLIAPLTNVVSRQVETRADLHSLELTGDVETFIASEQHLATVNLSSLDPNPVLYAFFYTHPTAPERIAFARAWRDRR